MTPTPRPQWLRARVLALFNLPFNDLLARAHAVHAGILEPVWAEAQSTSDPVCPSTGHWLDWPGAWAALSAALQ